MVTLCALLSCSNEKELLVISITSPLENSNFEHFSVVPIEYESNSSFSIDYYIDDYLIYSSSTPFSVYKWLTTNFSAGKHTIKIIVREEDGRMASDQIDINVIPSTKFSTGSLIDIEGNIYNTIKIGEQWWMAENLRTTKYNDGSPIYSETNNLLWSVLEKGAFCWYDNDYEANVKQYGALYNWYAVVTDKLCPTGWHVPSEGEVNRLILYLGSVDVIGNKLKAPCIWEWNNTNGNGSNESGFSALPGGLRFDYEDGFVGKIVNATWWIYKNGNPYESFPTFGVEGESQKLIRYPYSSGTGCSVRCVKY